MSKLPEDPTPTRARRGRTLARFAVGLLAAWLAATALTLVLAWRALDAAEAEVTDARSRLRDADLVAAGDAVATADDHLATADRWLSLPTTRIAAAAPGLGTSVHVSRDLTTALRRTTATATDALAALTSEGGIDALAPRDGRLPVDRIAALGPPLRAAAAALADATEVAAAAPAAGLARPVADARDRLLEVLPEAADQAARAAALAETLPGFLGADGPRRYLLGAANPAELRGTGGYVGALAAMTFDDGRFSLDTFTPAYALPTPDPADLPAPTADDERYTPFGGTIFWQNLNLTPDAPTAAAAFERVWNATHPEPVAGTILVDPFALEVLLDISGPVEVPGIGRTLDAESAVAFVANEAYALFDEQDERQEVLGAAAAAALQQLLRAPREDPRSLIERLAGLLSERHLIVHSVDPATQALFEGLGVAGALRDPDGDFVTVVLNSATASKVDYWLSRELFYDVRLLDGGRAEGRLTVELRNDAPRRGARRVVGPNNPDLEAGDNLLFVSTYCGTRCTLEGGPRSDGDRRSRLTTELGQPVWGSWHHIPARETDTLDYRWTIDDAWWTVDGSLHYRFTYQHQPMIRGTNLTVRLALPNGMSVVELPRNAIVEDGVLTAEYNRRRDLTLEVRLRPDAG